MANACGEDYFVLRSTLGGGTILPLPLEIREVIRDLTFPRTLRRCSRCNAVVLVESLARSVFAARTYMLADDNSIVCAECLTPSESLAGQMPRRGWLAGERQR